MSMFTLNTTMLLVHMWAMMVKMNSMFKKNRKKRLVLLTPVGM